MGTDPRVRIKGKFAEAVVYSLLERAGNNMRLFGQEWSSSSVQSLEAVNFRYVERNIKTLRRPDLALGCSSGRELIEVKFARDGVVDARNFEVIRGTEKYWPVTALVIVSLVEGDHFRVIERPPYFDGSSLKKGVPINDVKRWNITSENLEWHASVIRHTPQALFEAV